MKSKGEWAEVRNRRDEFLASRYLNKNVENMVRSNDVLLKESVFHLSSLA